MFQVEDLTSRLQHIRHATNIEQTLSLISAVWEMSLEFEIDYLDIQVNAISFRLEYNNDTM